MIRGIQPFGEDFQISHIKLSVDEDGQEHLDVGPVRLRKDMWSTWAQEVIEVAAATQALRPQIDAAVAAEDWDALTLLVHRELRYGMRAITGTAFAIDAFYASVKARAGAHPDEATWKAKTRPVPRHVQVFETLRFHLKLRAPGANDLQRLDDA